MKGSLKRSFRFSFFTALWISIAATGVVTALEGLFFSVHALSLLLLFIIVFLFAFFITQVRVEQLIYKSMTQLYKNVSLLASSPIQEQQVTTDMEDLRQHVERFAENKKLEIEALKIREDYRKEFIGNVSHELKTPLFTVQSYILTLLDGAKENEALLEKYLNRADKGVQRLIYIVEDLDMISKLEAGELKINREDFDIVQVIEEVFDLLEMKAAEREISLTLDQPYPDPITVNADKERIEQVLTNLVVNSIKYGQEKGTTEISIESLTAQKVIVRVTDNGEGFKKEDTSRLFERFYRIEKSRNRKAGGSGLGLSIVKHILEAHHEKMYVESDYGIGSEFAFTLEHITP